MPKKREDILYISGKQKNIFILRRYADYLEDKSFKPNLNKPAIYTRNHTHCYKIETPQGNLVLWSSKVYDTDRAKAKELLERILKEHKVAGAAIQEYQQVSKLTASQAIALISNPDSLESLSKPITFKNNADLTLYASGILLILKKLQRLVYVDTPATA
jgi:hypothetical protein